MVSADVAIIPVDPRLKVLKLQVLRDILSVQVNETALSSLAANLKANGSWAGIDCADKTRGGWPVNDHLTRLMNMAVHYVKPNTKFTDSQQFENKIIAGVDFWLKNDFICPNWWYPEIGVPKVLEPITARHYHRP
ncbi:MAG: hypothetical protein WKF89_17395 [Chitinophagaceae bacterium]